MVFAAPLVALVDCEVDTDLDSDENGIDMRERFGWNCEVRGLVEESIERAEFIAYWADII